MGTRDEYTVGRRHNMEPDNEQMDKQLTTAYAQLGRMQRELAALQSKLEYFEYLLEHDEGATVEQEINETVDRLYNAVS